MGKSVPQAPPAPDPYAVADAQGKANQETAITNAWIGNANENNPYGGVRYTQTGTQRVDDKDVPTFQRDVFLSPTEQAIKNQQDALRTGLNTTANNQLQRINATLSQPVDVLDMQPQLATGPGTPNINRGMFANFDPNAYSADRAKVEEAIYSRVNPQLERDREALETRLVNQGFQRGTDAFNQEMDAFGRQSNDARMQAVLAGGQEQSRLANLALQGAGFANAAEMQQFNADMARAGLQNATRQQGIQEKLAIRNQPINEISTLMNGGQVNVPEFSQFQYNPSAPAPIADSVYQSAAIDQANYRSQLAAQSAGTQGLFGLLGAGVRGLTNPQTLTAMRGMFALSDRRFKEDITDIGVRLANGLKLYAFKYLDGAKRHVGVMADEVARIRPDAVASVEGVSYVNYSRILGAY